MYSFNSSEEAKLALSISNLLEWEGVGGVYSKPLLLSLGQHDRDEIFITGIPFVFLSQIHVVAGVCEF